jgi:muramoyltetrapeptide carboxypeptidase
MELVLPERLREGDNLLVVAPSSNIEGVSRDLIQIGLKNIEKMGFNAEIHPSCKGSYKGTSGPPSERAKVLHDSFKNDEVDGIMCFWGGWNSNDLLDHLDWGLIRANPKVFIGYSDITVMNTVLYEKAGLVNFQGPAFITFTHEFLMPWEVKVFKDILMRPTERYQLKASPSYVDDPYYYKHPDKEVKKSPNPGWRIINNGRSRGRLIGGHLGTLLALAGTGYWPELEGKILFIEEDEGGNPKNVRRLFRQLEQIGALDEINGLLIGRIPEVTGIRGDLSIESLIGDIIEEADYPIITEMDIGHTNPIATLPVGIMSEITTDDESLIFLEPCIK